MNFDSMKYVSVLLLFGIGFGCSTVQPTSNKIASAYFPKVSSERIEMFDMLCGSWYGNKELEDGGIYEWITRRYPNGEYRLEGRITYPCHTVNNIEYGEWGFDENIEFVIQKGNVRGGEYQSKEPSYPYDWRIYEILEVSNDTYLYRHVGTGDTFKAKKVSDEFHLD